jgi:hypothetical protein
MNNKIKNILLLGDYSGFHFNLKLGLEKLGFNVTLISNGDNYKNIPHTKEIYRSKRNGIGRFIDDFKFLFFGIKDYYNFDVVQLVSTNIFGGLGYFFNYLCIEKLKKHSGLVFLSACGTDYHVFKVRNKLRYNYVDPAIKIDYFGKNIYSKLRVIINDKLVPKLVDGIIPSMYTYALAYSANHKIRSTVMLPYFMTYKPIITPINGKIKIFHGITRKGFKGTEYILEALNNVALLYPDKVEITIVERLSFDNYLQHLINCDILIDQSNSYDYGMNAVIGLANGKVVLSGNEPESIAHNNFSTNPVINILPNSEHIFSVLSELINNSEKIFSLKNQSYHHFCLHHDAVKIASKYLNIWEENHN